MLDNYDSFTYNLYDYLLQSGKEVEVIRNDVRVNEIEKGKYTGIVLSPGPGIPVKAGSLMEIIDRFHATTPILGVCLGHQAIGEYFGCLLKKATKPMHGKISEISLKKDLLFAHLPEKIKVTRYHSLILDNITKNLEVIAVSNEGEVMAIRHKNLNMRGIQFHPEAALTEFGKEIIFNWIKSIQ